MNASAPGGRPGRASSCWSRTAASRPASPPARPERLAQRLQAWQALADSLGWAACACTRPTGGGRHGGPGGAGRSAVCGRSPRMKVSLDLDMGAAPGTPPGARRHAGADPGLAHQHRQDHAGAHAARPRCRRGARRHPCDRVRRCASDDRGARRRAADAVGHARLRRQRAAGAAHAPVRHAAGLAAQPGLGPLARPRLLGQPAGAAQCARRGRCRALSGQRRRVARGGRLCRSGKWSCWPGPACR